MKQEKQLIFSLSLSPHTMDGGRVDGDEARPERRLILALILLLVI